MFGRRSTAQPSRRLLRRWHVVVAVLALAVVGPPLAIAGRCAFTKRAEEAAAEDEPNAVKQAKRAISGYTRGGSATFLTLPEWFIVYNAEDYATTLAQSAPSDFPYFRSIGQYWSYYGHVCDASCSTYPFDAGSHLMLGFVGTSFTIENAIKGIYESTIGRLTEKLASTDTEEDKYAIQTAVEYSRFMHMMPWYDFPFRKKLAGLWSDTHLWGPHLVRKWERRFALTLEYGCKGAYGWIVGDITRLLYGDEDQWVYAWAERVPDAVLRDPRVRSVSTVGRGAHILALRRYEAFTGIVPQLVAAGVRFNDIAGNQRILVTAVADRERTPPDDDKGRVLFAKALLTPGSQQRVAIDTSVGALGDVLKRLADSGATLEHIYDY